MFLWVLTLAFTAFAQTAAFADVKAFVGARIHDGTERPPIENATLVVRDGRVEAIGPSSSVRPPRDARVIGLKGKTITPGFHATHVHISDVQGTKPPAYTAENTQRQLGVYARYGITTLWSLGGEQEPAFEARRRQDTPELNRARLYLSGPIVSGSTPEEARGNVAEIAAKKPDILKIRVDDQLGTTKKMPPAVYKAIIEEAHKRDLRVAAHIFYLDDAKDLLRSGVDMIAHSVRDKEIDSEFISLMKARNIPYCPTLTRELSTFVYGSTPDFFTDPFFLREADPEVIEQLKKPSSQERMRQSRSAQAYKAALTVAKSNLKKASDAGLLIAMGTDSGATADRFQGYFEHLELEMMAESGLTPAQIIRSATGDAARAMKLENVGTLVKGKWADFNVFDRDPSVNIRNTRTLQSVWIAGAELPRDSK